MWSHDMQSRVIRLAAGLSLALLAAGCSFQPLYAERTASGGPGVAEAMRSVDILPIEAANGSPESRLAVEVRDQLLFGLQGGAEQKPATHRLRIRLASANAAVIVDPVTGRTDVGNYRLTAAYELYELRGTKPVVTGTAVSRVSFDVPGQEQRFARARGQRDAETRAAKVIAEDIKARLASYFVAGT
jgi:LPS-assembly lipoprotein